MFFLLSPIFSLLSKESLSFKIIKSQFTNVPDSAGAHGAMSQHNVTIIWYPQENTLQRLIRQMNFSSYALRMMAFNSRDAY